LRILIIGSSSDPDEFSGPVTKTTVPATANSTGETQVQHKAEHRPPGAAKPKRTSRGKRPEISSLHGLCRSQPGRLRLQTFDGLVLVDPEACMGAGANGIDLVLGGHRENHLAAFDRRHCDGDLDRRTRQGRGKMLDRYFHANRILVRFGMFQDKVAAGVLDIADQIWSRVDTPLLAHESDPFLLFDWTPAYQGDARLQAWFHVVGSC